MIRACLIACFAVALGITGADARHKKDHAAPEDAKKTAAEQPDPLTDPMAVPKWFGGAIDDILTGTGRALNLPRDNSAKDSLPKDEKR